RRLCLRLHRSATARRTNFAGVARSRRRLRQHAAGKGDEIEVAAGKGEVASRAEAMCRTPCRRRRHPHSPDGHRLRKFAPDSMLEGGVSCELVSKSPIPCYPGKYSELHSAA